MLNRFQSIWSGLFSSSLPIIIANIAWMGRNGMLLDIFTHPVVVHFTGQNWISKTGHYIRCVIVCKIFFVPNFLIFRKSRGEEEEDGEPCIHGRYLLYQTFHGDRQTLSLLHLAAETIIDDCNYHYYEVS